MQGNDIQSLIHWMRQVELCLPSLDLLQSDDLKLTVQELVSSMVSVLRDWPTWTRADCQIETAVERPNAAGTSSPVQPGTTSDDYVGEPNSGSHANASGVEPSQCLTAILAYLLSSSTPTVSLVAYETLLEELHRCRPKGDEALVKEPLAKVLGAVQQYGEGRAVRGHQTSQLQDALCDPLLIQGIVVKGLANATVRANAAKLLETCCDGYGRAFVGQLVPWQVFPLGCHHDFDFGFPPDAIMILALHLSLCHPLWGERAPQGLSTNPTRLQMSSVF